MAGGDVGAAQAGELPRGAVGQQPVAAAISAEAILDQQLLGDVGRILVPAEAKGLVLHRWIVRDFIASSARIFDDALGGIRVVGLEGLAVAQVERELLQPGFHRGDKVARVVAQRRDVHRAECACAVDSQPHVFGDVDRQQQGPAHLAVVVGRTYGVEGQAGLGRVVVDHIGEFQLVGAGGVRLGQHGLESIRGDVDHIGGMGELGQNFGAFVGEILEDDIPGLGLAEEHAGRAFVPVGALFPDRPEAGGVEAVQLVRARADKGVELKIDRIFDRLPDMLGHDPGRPPAVEEGGVEARVGDLELEGDRDVVDRRDRGHILDKEAVGVEPFVGHQRLDGEDHVGCGERLPVRPGDSLAQRDGQRSEVFVVVRVAGRQPRDDLAGGKIDRPERFVGQILHPAVTPFPADPLVEIGGRTDPAGQDVGNQRLVAGQIPQPRGWNLFCRCCSGFLGCRFGRRFGRRAAGQHQRCQQQPDQYPPCASHHLLLWTVVEI